MGSGAFQDLSGESCFRIAGEAAVGSSMPLGVHEWEGGLTTPQRRTGGFKEVLQSVWNE